MRIAAVPAVRATVLLLALAAVACVKPASRSLLLITVDTTRADRLGVYGHTTARTPTMDSLALRGTLYERAYATVPETLPSHSSMLTGFYPPSHGVRINLSFRLPPEAETLAEILRAEGFFSAAITSAAVLDRRYGLNQGFAVYRDPRQPRAGHLREEIRAEGVTRQALAIAERIDPRDRYFLWTHYYDAHRPYSPPEPWVPEGAQPDSAEMYDAEITYMDHWIGELLAELEERELMDDTLVILVGDHGESLSEHGESAHTLFIYDATIRVPLILAGPGVPEGVRVDEQVTTVGVFATALKMLGIEAPETSSRVFPGLPGGRAGTETPPLYSEAMAPALRYGWSSLAAIRDGEWLYVRAPRDELYRYPESGIGDDTLPNLAYSERRQLHAMRDLLAASLESMPDTGLEEAAGHNPDEQQRAELAALGYIGGDSSGGEEAGGNDPKDMVEVAEAIQLAWLAKRLERFDVAEDMLRFATSADPENPGGWLQLGQLYAESERFADAIEPLERCLELRPSNWEALTELAAAQEGLHRPEGAAAHLERALAISPFPEEVWRKLARLRMRREQWKEAAEAFRKVLEVEPDDTRANQALQALDGRGLL